MFNKLGVLNNIEYNFIPLNENILVIQENANISFLGIYNSSLEQKKIIKDVTAYDFVQDENNVVITNVNVNKSYVIDIFSYHLTELPYVLHLKGKKYGNKYLCHAEMDGKEYFLIISLINFDVIKKLDINIGFGNVQLWFDEIVISTRKRKGLLGVYDFNNTLLWQADVSQLGSYTSSDGTHPGEINNIYYTHEKVIVLTGLSVIAFSINDGSIVWHTKLDTWQSRGLLQQQYLYTTSNAYINKIDINTGDIYYQREFDYVTINGRKDLGPVSEFVWHKNAIWSIMDTNPSTLIALNPEDGSFNYVIPLPELGIKFDCQPPKFDGNRMYLLDFNHTLHIFERE